MAKFVLRQRVRSHGPLLHIKRDTCNWDVVNVHQSIFFCAMSKVKKNKVVHVQNAVQSE